MRRFTVMLAIALTASACGRGEKNTDAGPTADAAADVSTPDPADAGSPDTGGLPASERDDLVVLVDDVEVEFVDGYAERVAFEVPDEAISVVVSVVGDAGAFFTLSEWKNGDGSPIVPNGWLTNDQAAPALCLGCPNRIAASEASFAAIIPNSEQTELVAGTHNLTPYAYAQTGFAVSPLRSGAATLRVLAKLRPAAPEVGFLDINFHLTGAADLTAETAADDEEFQRTLDELRELYRQVGIELGTITYTDISEDYRVIESVIVPRSDLQEMFALSRRAPRPALNVFIVEELLSGFGSFGVLLGVSGGIPGPPMGATLRSGVAIATKRTPDVQTAMFKVLGHEMGHHLGLFHTSEQDLGLGGPAIHDPIGDTAEDDASFLMFNSGEGMTISVTQGQVMRANPWIQHQEAP